MLILRNAVLPATLLALIATSGACDGSVEPEAPRICGDGAACGQDATCGWRNIDLSFECACDASGHYVCDGGGAAAPPVGSMLSGGTCGASYCSGSVTLFAGCEVHDGDCDYEIECAEEGGVDSFSGDCSQLR